VKKAAFVNMRKPGRHAGQHLELVGAEIGIVAQNRFFEVRAVDAFDYRVPQTVEVSVPIVMHNIWMVELLHDFAAPFELAFAAPVEAKLGQQHPQDQALIKLVRDQVNVCHPTAVDLFEDGEVGESRANHCVDATVTNRALVCKRNPRKGTGYTFPGVSGK